MAQGPIPTVDVIEADRQLRDDQPTPLLVDVREVGEFVAVRAAAAALLPTSSFLQRIGELPSDRPLLIICHSGSRSAAVTAYLIRSGRSDVANVAGGMIAWERAGLAVHRGPTAPDEGAVPS
jgi:rhodanese-related sulfurtransferase